MKHDFIEFYKVLATVNAGKFGNYIRKEYNLSEVKGTAIRVTNKSEEEREEIRAIEKRNNELRRKYSKGDLL